MPGLGVHAFTATATERVRRDILAQLQLEDPLVIVGQCDRPNLTYRVKQRQVLAQQVMEVVERHKDRAGIVYCISRKDVERLADDLDQLRRQASEIDRSLTARRQLLAAMLGPDRRTRVGPFAIRTSAPAFSVKILDEQAVPAPFLSSSPDRKAILKHFQDTGEIPPGVDVNPRRTVVNVTRKG